GVSSGAHVAFTHLGSRCSWAPEQIRSPTGAFAGYLGTAPWRRGGRATCRRGLACRPRLVVLPVPARCWAAGHRATAPLAHSGRPCGASWRGPRRLIGRAEVTVPGGRAHFRRRVLRQPRDRRAPARAIRGPGYVLPRTRIPVSPGAGLVGGSRLGGGEPNPGRMLLGRRDIALGQRAR